ncbi:unnamed protein product [Gadus morhua 'NCC']
MVQKSIENRGTASKFDRGGGIIKSENAPLTRNAGGATGRTGGRQSEGAVASATRDQRVRLNRSVSHNAVWGLSLLTVGDPPGSSEGQIMMKSPQPLLFTHLSILSPSGPNQSHANPKPHNSLLGSLSRGSRVQIPWYRLTL